MSNDPQSRTGQTIRRAWEVWSDLDHAQRRLFETRTGLPEGGRARRDDPDAIESGRFAYPVRAWDEFEL